MYDVKSLKAEEFINDEEIQETLQYARENKNNRALVDAILKKAEDMKGISHREAAVLLECDLPDEVEKMFHLAKKIKDRFLRKPYCYVCTTVFVKLLCQWLYILSVPL